MCRSANDGCAAPRVARGEICSKSFQMEVVSRDAVYTVNASTNVHPYGYFTLSNCSALRKLVREDAARPRPKTHRKRALLGEEAKASQWHHSGSGGKYLYRAPRSVGGRSDNGLRGDPRAQGAPRGTVSARGARGRGLAARGSKKNHRESRAVGRAAIRTRSGKFLSCPFS